MSVTQCYRTNSKQQTPIMEELNEMQSAVNNEDLQPVVEQAAPAATDNDSNTTDTMSETGEMPETITTAEAPSPVEETPVTAVEEVAVPAPEPIEAAVEPNPEKPTAEAEEEPEADYSAMSREELLAALNELLEGDITAIRNRASTIRNQFNTLNKEVERQAFEAFLAEGGNKDDYTPSNDAVAEAFYAAYDVYRTRRQKMQEEMEAQKQRNLEAKQQILDELRALIDKDEETLKQTYDEFNAIQ